MSFVVVCQIFMLAGYAFAAFPAAALLGFFTYPLSLVLMAAWNSVSVMDKEKSLKPTRLVLKQALSCKGFNHVGRISYLL
jgi:hypothetical protein